MPFDPAVMFDPPPRAVRVTSELIAHYTMVARRERSRAFAAYLRAAWTAVVRFSCWFRRPSVQSALRDCCG